MKKIHFYHFYHYIIHLNQQLDFLYPIYAGGAIAYCEGVKHLAENIKKYQITAMISVQYYMKICIKKSYRERNC